MLIRGLGVGLGAWFELLLPEAEQAESGGSFTRTGGVSWASSEGNVEFL